MIRTIRAQTPVSITKKIPLTLQSQTRNIQRLSYKTHHQNARHIYHVHQTICQSNNITRLPSCTHHSVIRKFSTNVNRIPDTVKRVEQVANPRLFNQPSRISDALGCLTAQQITELDAILDQMRTDSLAEIAVVTLESVELEPHQQTHPEYHLRQFAIDLFNYWKIGDASRNDGVLLLIVRSARRIECVTGRSINDDQWVLDTLITRTMVPSLKVGRYDTAIISGVQLMQNRSLEWRKHVLEYLKYRHETEFQPITAVERTELLGAEDAPRPVPTREEFWSHQSGRRKNPFMNFLRPLLATCAAVIFFRVLFGSDDRPRSNRRTRFCPSCKSNQLKVIGVASSANVRGNNGQRSVVRDEFKISSPDMQNDSPVEDSKLDASVGLIDPDRSVDFEIILNSLSSEERGLLQSGMEFNCMVCMECNQLVVQQREPSLQPGQQLHQVHRKSHISTIPLDFGVISPAAATAQKRPVVRLDPEPNVIDVKGRDITRVTSNSPPVSTGFGGGTSNGSGGGGSF